MCSRPTPSTSCRAAWSGASRKATPASRATTRRTRSSSRSMAPKCIPRRSAGPKDHEVQARDMNEAKVLIDARMTGRVAVTAGPHEVGLHVEGAAVPAAGCVAARAARQPGNPYGRRHAAAPRRERRGPLQRERGQQHAEPRTALRVPPGVGRRGAGVRREDPDESGAARLPASRHGGRWRGADRVLQAGA